MQIRNSTGAGASKVMERVVQIRNSTGAGASQVLERVVQIRNSTGAGASQVMERVVQIRNRGWCIAGHGAWSACDDIVCVTGHVCV